ncbi:glyoxalase-like protein [Actinocorallia herbida]|uniref:Glyoxalase-like protein n=1 Tax=Actinocorallia herbida TaxID=58109 RepID=A0A3N1D089_9ACTN|nr:VOC family protein [Actinocorallia herbida]ROO86458.1 glyoxalase-like protein [Actinocorallia herbida]
MSGPLLVQATVAAADLAPAAAAARALLGVPPGFPDPELASWGIVNEILGLGDGTYLEIVAPATPESALHGFLKRGEGGYVVGVKVPDTDALVERAAKLGVEVAHRQDFHGADIVQFKPGRLGAMLEADRLPDGAHWHYDTWDTPARPADAPTGRLLAVDLAVTEPEQAAALWAELLDAEPAGPTAITAGDAVIRFVPATGRRGLVAADIAAPEAAEHTVAGLLLRLTPKETA